MIKKKILKNVWLFVIMGLVYFVLEGIFRVISGESARQFNLEYITLQGHSSLWMMLVGGISGWLIGYINELRCLKNLKMIFITLIGCFIISSLELVSGAILNILLNFNLWDYSKYPINLLGQIELFHSIGWLFITPLTVCLDDALRAWIFDEGKAYSPLIPYKKLFTLK